MEENFQPIPQKRRFFEVTKKKISKTSKKTSQRQIHNNKLLPDGNEDQYDEAEIEDWAINNIAFLGKNIEWGNDQQGNDWVEAQNKIHEGVFMDASKIKKSSPKDSKIIQLQSNESSPLFNKKQNGNAQFTDRQFPTNQTSLTGQWGLLQKYKEVGWKRATQELKGCKIFKQKISPKDIIQGKLGNCYFLAGLGALAQRPDRIFNLFLVRQINDVKYFAVRILLKGRWTVIDLDEYFPFTKNHKPIFSHAVREELWVMILEKAWAKLYSSYMRISAGHTEQPLHDLTGAPINFFKLKDKNLDKQRLWKYLMKASKKQYAMCVSSNKGSDQKMSETGIVQGHAYTILNATILKFQGEKIRLMQLRNPWGRKENTGSWGDKDPRWKKVSEKQKQRLQYQQTLKDGIFYIQFEDLLNQYRAITIAEINDNASYVYETIKDPNISGVFFKVELKQTGLYSFQIDKTSKRTFNSKQQIGYKYPSAVVKIFSTFDNYNEIHHFDDNQRLTSRRYSLYKGLYIVYVLINFDKKYEKDYDVTLAIYSECQSSIQIATKKEIGNIVIPKLKHNKSQPKPKRTSKSRPKNNGKQTKVSSIRFNYMTPVNNLTESAENFINDEILKFIISSEVQLQIKQKRTNKRPFIQIGGKANKTQEESNSKKHWGNHIDGQEWIDQQAQNHLSQLINGVGKSMIQMVKKQVVFIEPCPQGDKIEETKTLQKDFIDQRFPPSKSSLTGQWGDIQQWKNVRWQRISKINPNAKIFQGKISPQSIKQGFLGDCYFLAGIAALAQRPDRIFNLFLQHERNGSNSYSVKMLYKGKWLTIHMDDYVPYMYDLPAFSRANKDELWVILLQKAWAKIYSSFKRIQAGFPQQTLHDLTGAPIRHIYLQRSSFDVDRQWLYLMNATAHEYSMVASSQAGSDSLKSVTGIVQGHAYTLLKVAELSFNNHAQRIVQLRNPWGKGQNTGKWSDNDPNWNLIDQKTKAKLGYAKIDDGIFYMPYQSFCKEFKIITIAQINDNASYVYKSAKDPMKNGCFFKVQILQKGKYSFQVDSTPQRTFEFKYNTNYRYPNIKFQLGMLADNGYIKRITSMEQNSRTSFYISQFQVGFYLCFVRIDFDETFQKDFDVNLAIYGDYISHVDFATKKQAVLFSNDPNIKWGGNEAIKKPAGEWNALRSYRPDHNRRSK